MQQDFYLNTTFLKFVLTLTKLPGWGCSKINKILDNIADTQKQFALESLTEFRDLQASAEWSKLEKSIDTDLEFSRQLGCFLITRLDPLYPALLKEISDAPPVLYGRGNPQSLSLPQIAMVGSRNPSYLGRELAVEFAKVFTESGFIVTSGMALGIDTASHQGALGAKGQTIAVLGNGLDRIYPAANKKLAASIIENGVIVSELPIGTRALPHHFPRRNRIISGLSVGTLVVEAALESGSLITAECALEQGREVFAMPGSIKSSLSKGCHALIRQGAKLIETPQEVLEELGSLCKFVKAAGKPSALNRRKSGASSLLAMEKRVLMAIGLESTSLDRVAERSQLTIQEVSIMLLELELKGLIVQVAGGYIRFEECTGQQ